ncbi:putative transmembrane protein [Toxoplasma gondii VAND]|uniref:Putative transmembrane protein n=1 Tax=Toxoplasma gondii VAND TaxID=933077 RepID=A0A086Q7Q8_TOXGO|nr:putative transmembrane protein [Toxoplasma gondii VAND]
MHSIVYVLVSVLAVLGRVDGQPLGSRKAKPGAGSAPGPSVLPSSLPHIIMQSPTKNPSKQRKHSMASGDAGAKTATVAEEAAKAVGVRGDTPGDQASARGPDEKEKRETAARTKQNKSTATANKPGETKDPSTPLAGAEGRKPEFSNGQENVVDESDTRGWRDGSRSLIGTENPGKAKTRRLTRPACRRLRYAIGLAIGTVLALLSFYGYRRYRDAEIRAERNRNASAYFYLTGRRNAAVSLAQQLRREMDRVSEAIRFHEHEQERYERARFDEDAKAAMETTAALEDVREYFTEKRKEVETLSVRLAAAADMVGADITRQDMRRLTPEQQLQIVRQGRFDEARSLLESTSREANLLRELYVPGIVEAEEEVERAEPGSEELFRRRRDLREKKETRLGSAVDHHLARVIREIPFSVGIPEEQAAQLRAPPGIEPVPEHVLVAMQAIERAQRT